MRHFIAWAVKNRQNVVLFDDTWASTTEFPSPEILQYMHRRGLKTILNVHPGNAYRLDPDVSKQDLCDKRDPRMGIYYPVYCVDKPGFWKLVDKRLKTAAKYRHMLAGLICNQDEGPLGWRAEESAEGVDPVDNSLAGFAEENSGTRYLKPKLYTSACSTCGEVPNAAKWARALQRLNGPQGSVAQGLPPVGHGRAHCAVADPDDELVAREVVPHLAPGSLSMVWVLPNCNRANRVESWPRLIDEMNRKDNGKRKVFLLRELIYGCSADMPLAVPSTLDSIDIDFEIMRKYESTATCAGGTYVMHSLGWLMDWYSMRKQWDPSARWQSWLPTNLSQVLGREAVELAVEALELVRDVQMYDGLVEGEYCAYYTMWGLNPHHVAPETIPLPNSRGPFRYDKVRGNWWGSRRRLVEAGARDKEGVYTAENLAPADRRLRRLRGKLDAADARITRIEGLLAPGVNRMFWEEHLVRTLRYTTAFLRSRTAVALSYSDYAQAREQVRQGRDTSAVLAEGEKVVREALNEQDFYIRRRPGFGIDYPYEMNPDTLRWLLEAWRGLRQNPEKCLDLDLLAFLDRAETEVAQGH